MTKRLILAVALVVAFSMVFAACGDSEASAPSAKNTASATILTGLTKL